MAEYLQTLSNIKLHHLRYFSVLASELHFGRAAQKLSITQPPLSTAIRDLEYALGVKLFERDSKKVSLTDAGAAFRSDISHVLQVIDRAAKTARSIEAGQEGRLDIGLTAACLYRELPKIVHHYTDQTPGMEVFLHEVASATQVNAILQGRLQGGFINASSVEAPLQSIELKAAPFVLCLPEDHRLAGRKIVALEEVAGEHFVMFAREVAPDNHDNVLAILRRAGVSPRTAHAARQWLTVTAMVAHGFGIALVPDSIKQTGLHGVRFVDIEDDDGATPARAHFVWNSDMVSEALAGFIECVSDVAKAPDIPAPADSE